MTGLIVVSLFIYPLLDFSFFPRTDAGQFVMNVKLSSGTRIGVTEQEVAKIEDLVRKEVSPEDLGMIVSNIGSTPDFSAM
jgi:multidrug efflux pump subunit AcrB